MRIQGENKTTKKPTKEPKTCLSALWNLWRGKFIDPFSEGSFPYLIHTPNIYNQIHSKILLMINRIFYTNKRGDLHGLVD